MQLLMPYARDHDRYLGLTHKVDGCSTNYR
jgi:hypothetical protein